MIQNVYEWLVKASEQWPSKEALLTEKRILTFSELRRESEQFAHSCILSGLKKGERVLIHTSDLALSVIAIFGTLLFGGTFVILHPKTPLTRLNYYLNDSGASLLIADHPTPVQSRLLNGSLNVACYVRPTLDSNPQVDGWIWINKWMRVVDSSEEEIPLKLHKHELAGIIYTSGSTGQPKGIMSSHENIIFSTQAINQYLKHTPKDKILSYLPLSFDYGLYQIFLACSTGATLYLRDSSYFPLEIIRIILRESITGLPGLRNILSFLIQSKQDQIPSLRYVTNSGDALPPTVVDKMQVIFPKADIFLMYGLTECKRASYLPPEYLPYKPMSVGIPLIGTSAVIVNQNEQECQPMEQGELIVQGPHVCLGYWNRKEETQSVFYQVNGKRYLRTGDLFYKDNEGFLYYVSRKDKLFKSRGYRIDPLEIENVIISYFHLISEVVVVGIPDVKIGRKIGAYVVLNGDLASNKEHMSIEIKKYCKKVLEPWKVPDIVYCSTSIPLTSSGKIDKEKVAMTISITNKG
jgi:long-chain acyl-CoA synthetase